MSAAPSPVRLQSFYIGHRHHIITSNSTHFLLLWVHFVLDFTHDWDRNMVLFLTSFLCMSTLPHTVTLIIFVQKQFTQRHLKKNIGRPTGQFSGLAPNITKWRILLSFGIRPMCKHTVGIAFSNAWIRIFLNVSKIVGSRLEVGNRRVTLLSVSAINGYNLVMFGASS